MDFTLTTAQDDLAALSRQILTDRVTAERLRELDTAPARFDPDLWAALASAGVLSAALPEQADGAGLGLLEQCSVLIEAGRTVAPVPYLPAVVLGAAAIAEFGTRRADPAVGPACRAGRAHPDGGAGRGGQRGPAVPGRDGTPVGRWLAADRNQDDACWPA